MMKSIRITLLTTCVSFTLVVLVNCLFGVFIKDYTHLNRMDIFQIALTCFMVSVGIWLATLTHFYKEHFYISSYTIMLVVVFSMEFLLRGEFSFCGTIIEFIMLTLIYIIVCYCVFFENEKDSKIINDKIKNRRKGNIK